MNEPHSEKGHRQIHAVFKNHVMQGNDARGWGQGYKECGDPKGNQSISLVGEHCQDNNSNQQQKGGHGPKCEKLTSEWVVPIYVLIDRPEVQAEIGEQHTQLGQKILFPSMADSRIVKEVFSDQRC